MIDLAQTKRENHCSFKAEIEIEELLPRAHVASERVSMNIGIHEFCDAWYFAGGRGFLRSRSGRKKEKRNENGYSFDQSKLRAGLSRLEAACPDWKIHGEVPGGPQ